MIQHERVQFLNEKYPRRGRYVLYWMQQSQRAHGNHALEFAIREANGLKLPVIVGFGITQRFPEGQERHYAFMLEGLRETQAALAKRGIKLAVRLSPPPLAALDLAAGAALLVADCGYLRIQRRWRDRVAREALCRVVQVESDVVVPVETASDREEYAARTIRPKIERHLSRFLKPLAETRPKRDSLESKVAGLDVSDVDRLLKRLRVGRRALRAQGFRGGTTEARKRLAAFLKGGLKRYDEDHSDPGKGNESGLSPYLHFGHVSPLEIALAVRSARGVRRTEKDAFLEELIVRRELSMNFCRYNPSYDSLDGLPDWARGTLAKHARDRRERTYGRRALVSARTHDPYWNAAQRELLLTGKMHGYMRMYWGKKIIEWSRSPDEAFRTALALNNRYELDGRDPNSFAGVAWCFGKHDRPWKERKVFGTVRWMSDTGLKRKFDMDAYVARVDALAAEAEEAGEPIGYGTQ
jgi:deoxyribodipyrimidine photo-lyase